MQRDLLVAVEHFLRADGLYLQAIASPDQRQKSLAQAKTEYEEAWRWYAIQILKYYVDDTDATAIKYASATVQEKTLPELRDPRKAHAHRENVQGRPPTRRTRPISRNTRTISAASTSGSS